MLSTPFAFAPAGVLGTGSAVARPHACAAVRPSLAGALATVQGTGVPFAGMARRRGAAPAGLGFPAALLPIEHDTTPQNDGTTPFGIHSPGRPTS